MLRIVALLSSLALTIPRRSPFTSVTPALHYPKWMARWQQVATAAQRKFLRLGRRDLSDEQDYLRRYGDGARLDGLASRGIYWVTRLADPLHRGDDALGLFVFVKPDRG